ncbi:MAG: nucleotidyltransferase family protein [Candidatus Sedimenticola sp. (ex Thyasira tokunagai)]
MTKRDLKAVLLAGGYGTRLKPLTDSIPKCLVIINERPLIDFWIEKLNAAGVKEALINTHYLPIPVRNYIRSVNLQGKINLVESYEEILLGSAGTVSNNADFADDCDQVLLIYTDNLSDIDLNDLLDFHLSHDEPITMLLFHAENPATCGIATLDESDLVEQFIEKPENPESDLANGGIYIIDSNTYREIAQLNAFDFGFDVLPHYVGKMKGFILNGYHRDIGTLESLDQAHQDISDGVFKNTLSI